MNSLVGTNPGVTEGKKAMPVLQSDFRPFHSLGLFNLRGQLQLCLVSAEQLCSRIAWCRWFFITQLEVGLSPSLQVFLSCVYPVGCFSAAPFTVLSPSLLSSASSAGRPVQAQTSLGKAQKSSSHLLSHPLLPKFKIFTASCTKHLICFCPLCHLLTESGEGC